MSHTYIFVPNQKDIKNNIATSIVFSNIISKIPKPKLVLPRHTLSTSYDYKWSNFITLYCPYFKYVFAIKNTCSQITCITMFCSIVIQFSNG